MILKIVKMCIPVLGPVILEIELVESHNYALSKLGQKVYRLRIVLFFILMLGVFLTVLIGMPVLYRLITQNENANYLFVAISFYVAMISAGGVMILEEVFIRWKIKKMDNEKLNDDGDRD